MLLAFVAALIAAAATPQPSLPGKAQLRFDPMYAYTKLKPGESGQQTFKIRNVSKHAIHVDLFRRDAWHNTAGGRTFPEPGTIELGLAKWLQEPRIGRVRIAGDSELEVTDTVKVPANTRPAMYIGALMIRFAGYENEAGEVESAERIVAGVRTNDVVALTLHVEVPPADGKPPAPEVALIDQQLELPTDSKPLVARIRLANKSDWEVRPTGTLAVFDAIGRPIGKAAFDSIVIWPRQESWITATFATTLPAGTYHGLAAFAMQDPGDQQIMLPSAPIQKKFDFTVSASQPLLRDGEAPATAAGPSPGKQAR